jgi:hypothetical protein
MYKERIDRYQQMLKATAAKLPTPKQATAPK